MAPVKQQTARVGAAGSFFNQIMANNATTPEVGKGATQLHYTDRTCFEVIEVSPDGSTARLEYLQAAPLSSNIGHQNWELKPTGRFLTVTWRKNAWYIVGKEIVFTAQFRRECESRGAVFIAQFLRKTDPELADKIWGTEGHTMPQNVINGVTKEKKCYTKIKIIFGVKDYYYDWSF